MKKTVTALLVAGMLGLAAPAHSAATFPEYQQVQPGWYRNHVQRLFGTHGHLVVLWADETGERHLTKTYPTDTRDTRIRITYTGPPSQHPHRGPFRVVSKALITP